MKLTDFDKKEYAPQALKETYKLSFDVSNMSLTTTQDMLKKVRGLATEAKQSPDFYKNQSAPAYMKLVFMEQALVSHFNDLASRPRPRIVIENSVIEQSQVYLAAEDLYNSVQKMLEEVCQMQVKELPALVDSIESELDMSKSQSYNDIVSAQLDTLSAALKEASIQLKTARDSLTPDGAAASFDTGADMGADMGADLGADMGADLGADMGAAAGAELGADMGAAEEPEAPEAQSLGGAGRAKR